MKRCVWVTEASGCISKIRWHSTECNRSSIEIFMCGVGEGEEAAYRNCGRNEMYRSTKTCRDTRDAAR